MLKQFPSFAQNVLERIYNDLGFVMRILLASSLTYFIINDIMMKKSDLTGVLAAILVVQTRVSETFKQALERIFAIITGVLIAIFVSTYGGLNLFTLFFILAASLMTSAAFNLRNNKLEVPISALLILGVSQIEVASEGRILNSLIGMIAGILVSIAFPPKIRNEEAIEAVTGIAENTADIIENYAIEMHEDANSLDSSKYVNKIHDVLPQIIDATETIKETKDDNKMNPRSYITPQIIETLQKSTSTLDTCVVSLREIMVNMYAQNHYQWSDDQLKQLTETVSTILYDVSKSIRLYGEYTQAIAENRVEEAEQRLSEMLKSLKETQAIAYRKLFVEGDNAENLIALRFTLLESVNTIISVLSPEDMPEPVIPARIHLREVKKSRAARMVRRSKKYGINAYQMSKRKIKLKQARQ